MKHIIFKKAFVAASVISVLGYVGSASAHTLTETLGQGAKSTDYFVVGCSGGTHHLAVQIQDLGPVASPLVSVQVNSGTKVKNITDPVDGDAGSSPERKVVSGDTDYFLTVDKTGAGVESYLIDYHCENSSGGHTTTIPAEPLQNQ